MTLWIQNIKTHAWAQILVIYTRYLIGGSFVFSSIVKIQGNRFTTISGADFPIDSAWHLFETLYQSGLYWQFLGAGQLVAGLLLMTQRFSRLGALLFLPVVGNIFIITISYDFNYTPVITGMLLLANVALVLWDWNTLRVIVNLPAVADTGNRLEDDRVWIYTGILLFLFTAIYRFGAESYDLILWLGGCSAIGIASGAYWFYDRHRGKLKSERNA